MGPVLFQCVLADPIFNDLQNVPSVQRSSCRQIRHCFISIRDFNIQLPFDFTRILLYLLKSQDTKASPVTE